MRKEIGWGNGCSTLFLAPAEDGGFVLYDYEFDYEKIHQLCGGMNYYQSRSGDTGEGYITKLDELIKVGFYRVDTKYNDFQFPEDIGNGYSMMLPYATHMEYKDTILAQNPVVIKDGNRIIFCSYYDNMCEIVMNLFTQQKLEKSPRILKRNFYDVEYDETYEQEIMFYNMFGYCRQYPWEFCKEYLKRFECEEYENERLHSLFNIVEKDGNLYTTTRIAGRKYYTGVLKENPFADLKEDFCNQHGWKLEDGIIYKYKEKDVFVFGFVDYSALYKKNATRLASFIPETEKKYFEEYLLENMQEVKYADYEVYVPKMSFLFNKKEIFADVRKGISKKVRKDVIASARQYIKQYNEKQLVEAIPDDFVIKFEDSLASGNCQPGTEDWVNEHFPGKKSISAGELKKFKDNWNVMRVLRYVAQREGFSAKKINEIPAA